MEHRISDYRFACAGRYFEADTKFQGPQEIGAILSAYDTACSMLTTLAQSHLLHGDSRDSALKWCAAKRTLEAVLSAFPHTLDTSELVSDDRVDILGALE